ncbi:MAG: hypothetical protein M0Z87_00740 [Actinomycetota bacterium]|nr:hypothetical protein [Actinomycetota bacterium]
MLASINPLGERARGNKWALTALSYLAGSMMGGALVVGSAAAVGRAAAWLAGAHSLVALVSSGPGRGWAAEQPWMVPGLVGGLCLIAALADATAVPTIRRQVNEDWLVRYRGWVYGVGFGLQLGSGVATTVTTASVYLMLLLSFLDGSPAGAVIGACFGAARALPVLTTARVTTPAALRAAHARLDARWGTARRATVVALMLTALAVPVAAAL